MEKGNGYGHILKYTSLFGGIQGINILVSLVRNKLVALILGPEGMGLVSLFNSTIKLVSDSTNFGLQMSAVRNISEAVERGDEEGIRRAVRTLRTLALLTALLGMLVCMVAGPFFNHVTFSWGDHSLHFILLSPVVALLAITGGETAVLKATRRLKALATISVLNVFFALLTSVPIYYYFGQRGIVPSLILMAFTQMLLTIAYSYRQYPLQLAPTRQALSDGIDMVQLGMAFVVAGILGSGADFLIRSYLNMTTSLEMVGLYNAGYMITVTYAGMVFMAMETDFFPRLSAVNQDVARRNEVVNKQVEVSLLMISPMLVALILVSPWLIPMLFSSKFSPAVGMVQITMLALYFRAVKLPVAYLPLATGDSRSYLLLEAIYDVLVVILVVAGFRYYGLRGAGWALTITGIMDFLIIYAYARHRYHFAASPKVLQYLAIQLPIGILAYLSTCIASGWGYWVVGLLLLLASAVFSIKYLRR